MSKFVFFLLPVVSYLTLMPDVSLFLLFLIKNVYVLIRLTRSRYVGMKTGYRNIFSYSR